MWYNSVMNLEDIVKESTSYQEVGLKLGTSRQTATRKVKEAGLDISHFRPGRGRFYEEDKVLTLGERKINQTVVKYVLRNGLLTYRCSWCSLGPEWQGRPLTLELDHINGNPLDNRIENLRFLCPNCHTQTDTCKGRNAKR